MCYVAGMDTYNVRLSGQTRQRLVAARLAYSNEAGRVITMSETIERLLDQADQAASKAAS